MPSFLRLAILAAVVTGPRAAVWAQPPSGPKPAAAAIDFNRDIRPILSDGCYTCHGPDENQRTTELRLDTPQGALADLGGYRAIVPGQPRQSELVRRITSSDPDERMPPADSGRTLTGRQVDLLKRWVASGAQWREHWSFQSVVNPPIPKPSDPGWMQNPIDAFVLARLDREGLRPSFEADRATLIRRLALDLTGLPPTLDQVDRFLADRSPDAYRRLVDRLLQSPRFGERMAQMWLDAARYADTSGYQNDGPRYMWRWRDWVIQAFNRNLPYDQFTVEQIAGDLLDDPTLAQRIATGFNRNHRGNAEGGIIPEEFQVEYVVDRVETTATVWLGLTLGCGRCHDHKYDPLSQRDFYRFFAYFNNIPENGRAIKEGNSPPVIKAPTAEQRRQLRRLDAQLAAAERGWQQLANEVSRSQAAWEQSEPSIPLADSERWSPQAGRIAAFPLDGPGDQPATAAGASATAKSTAVKNREPRPVHDHDYTHGKIGHAIVIGEQFLNAGDLGRFGYFDKFSLAAWIRPESGDGTIVSRMTPTVQGDGYYVHLHDGQVQVNLVKRWLDDAIRVQTRRQLELGRWHHVLVTYDGSRVARGIRIYIDGSPAESVVHLDAINQSFASDEPLRIGGGDSNFRGAMDEVLVYDRDLSAAEAELLATADTMEDILRIPAGERSSRQAAKMRAFYLQQHAPATIRGSHRRLTELRRQRRSFWESVPTVMVMQERERRRPTFVLLRGQYDKPGDPVQPGVPANLPPLRDGAPDNRLGLARWLVDPSNPLTARVAVNRFWQLYFGTGLVKTAEDFGVQGEPPSHPELLDWLAAEFMRSGWDVKALQRLIVTSATYRQSSERDADLAQRDPRNRLLARGPRFRLPAETIRDSALAISGMLQQQLGGPSVRPYQPEGLWKEIATDTDYRQSQGADLYRRSLYTYWKRTVPPPAMGAFDATSREACIVKRSRTNTPLQALALMNDVTFVEAARVLAEQIMREADQPDRRIELAFRHATCRPPEPGERQVLMSSWRHYRQRFQADHDAARRLLAQGQWRQATDLDPAELAAYAMISSLILNLDEVITKE